MKLRLVLPLLIAALAALLVAGCGGGDEGGSGDPAAVAPPKAPVYLDVTLRPEGETKQNIEALAKNLLGIDDPGALIVSELEEEAAEDGEEFDYEKEVEPWLGEEAGLFLQEYVEEEFEGYGAALQTTDEDAAREFLNKQLEAEDEAVEDGSYEGVDFKVQEDETTFGVFDGLVVFAENEEIFKSMVDASGGESLAGEEAFGSATGDIPEDSAANVYVDIGALIEEAGGEIDAETKTFLDSVGIKPDEATAVASLVPGADQVELEISTNVSENPPAGDASELVGSMPADSVAAFASGEFGKRFNEGIDRIDEQGIPSEGIEPNELKKGLKEAGIDLEAITSSIGDVGFFVKGSSERNLGGALILTTEDATQAKNTVSNIGLFIRASGTPGVTAINGKATGFSIRDPELGPQPAVVVAKGSRIAIGYGLDSTLAAFEESGQTLADSPTFKEAVSALGGTPITAFVDGPAALKLATGIVPPGEVEFEEAQQFLEKIDYVAVGSEADGDVATAKLIVGLGE